MPQVCPNRTPEQSGSLRVPGVPAAVVAAPAGGLRAAGALRARCCWRSDSRPGLVSGEDLRALLEVDGEQAEALMKVWISKPYRASGPLDSGARRSATVGTIRRRHKKEP